MIELYESVLKLLQGLKRNEGESFCESLNNVLDSYSQLVSDTQTALFAKTSDKELVLTSIQRIKNDLKDILSKVDRGECAFGVARHILEVVLRDIRHYTMQKGKGLYRARFSCENLSCEDMFHILCREHVNQSRFNAKGNPALYLSDSMDGCWKELDKPKMNEFNVSKFIVTRDVKLYDLRIPIKQDFAPRNLKSTLIMLALTIACSFPVLDEDYHKKPEYIIPALISKAIIERNEKATEKDCKPSDVVWGIAYSSVKNVDSVNVVLPAIRGSAKDVCSYLASIFKMSPPKCSHDLESLDKEIEQIKCFKQLNHLFLDTTKVIVIGNEGGNIDTPLYSNGKWSVKVGDDE